MRLLRSIAAAVVPLTMLSACLDTTAPRTIGVEEATFAPALGVDLSTFTRTASGLYYRDVSVGTGPVVTSGQTVGIYYLAYLANGAALDSVQTGTPFSFTAGAGQVIPGVDEGVQGMNVGGVRRLLIPPGLAYGPYDYAVTQTLVIPGQSVLVFTVTMVSAQ